MKRERGKKGGQEGVREGGDVKFMSSDFRKHN